MRKYHLDLYLTCVDVYSVTLVSEPIETTYVPIFTFTRELHPILHLLFFSGTLL